MVCNFKTKRFVNNKAMHGLIFFVITFCSQFNNMHTWIVSMQVLNKLKLLLKCHLNILVFVQV